MCHKPACRQIGTPLLDSTFGPYCHNYFPLKLLEQGVPLRVLKLMLSSHWSAVLFAPTQCQSHLALPRPITQWTRGRQWWRSLFKTFRNTPYKNTLEAHQAQQAAVQYAIRKSPVTIPIESLPNRDKNLHPEQSLALETRGWHFFYPRLDRKRRMAKRRWTGQGKQGRDGGAAAGEPQALPPHQVSGLTNSWLHFAGKGLKCLIQAFLSHRGSNTQSKQVACPNPKTKKNNATNVRVRHIRLYSLRATNVGVTKVNPSNTPL
eukprot:g60158.t1